LDEAVGKQNQQVSHRFAVIASQRVGWFIDGALERFQRIRGRGFAIVCA
jgi:hypothetical protein